MQVQATEAALVGDKAAVEAAESKVRTLAATAIQEWGPVIGHALVNGAGLVTRLIERQEFLLQITLPPGRVHRSAADRLGGGRAAARAAPRSATSRLRPAPIRRSRA